LTVDTVAPADVTSSTTDEQERLAMVNHTSVTTTSWSTGAVNNSAVLLETVPPTAMTGLDPDETTAPAG
jgi:hypothetical protein